MCHRYGKKIWFFPDGEIPPETEADTEEYHGHESLIILNPNRLGADIQITVYFPDKPPRKLNAGSVEAERVRCIRTNEPIDGFNIPHGCQYALKVEASEGVICQLGRMDVSRANLAYYTTMGFTGC